MTKWENTRNKQKVISPKVIANQSTNINMKNVLFNTQLHSQERITYIHNYEATVLSVEK